MKAILHHSKRLGKHVMTRTSHLFFPWIIHYFTDKYQTRHHHVVVDTILSMTMIVLIGFNVGLLYWFYLAMTPANLQISLSAPEYIVSGSNIAYQVDYYNPNKKITDLNFELLTPAGFTYQNSNLPKNSENNIFYLDELKKKQSGQLLVDGKIIANIKETQRVVVIARYRYHGQYFLETVATEYNVNDANFETAANLPEQTLNNQEFTWSVHYHNDSPETRENVAINLDIPSTLEIISTPENYNLEKQEILLPKVEPWSEGDVQFTSIFSKAVGESDTLVKVRTNFDLQNVYYLQNQTETSVNVLTPRLTLTASAPTNANIGQSLSYQITCNNIGDAELKNVKVIADISSINNSGVSAYAKDGSINNNQATWEISSIAPNTKQNLFLVAQAPSNLRKENLAISLSAKAIANIEDLTLTTYSQSSESTVKYNSTLNFAVEARYYGPDNEQIGYGPYPLKAEQITAMRVFWNVKDFTNDLNNVTITTTLPSQVEWTGSSAVSQGANITYNSKTRQVTWHTSYIPAFAGPQGVSFEVRISPNYQQIGKPINITNETYFSAQDSFTYNIITRGTSSLRTPVIEE